MKKFYAIFILTFLLSAAVFGQDIQVVVHENSLTDTLGSEMVFDFEIINISAAEQTVFEVRTLNQLPANWVSSLCFGQSCFPPGLDSIATVQEFSTPPLQPGDTLETSVHVFTSSNHGTANIQIQVGTFRRPDERTTIDFTASTNPVGVNDNYFPGFFSLNQNYPNPFNPMTRISYSLGRDGYVTLSVFDILGSEAAVLINEYQQAGEHTVDFNAAELTSGIYIYKLQSGSFTSSKKMILVK